MAIFKITHENKAVFDGEKFSRQIRCEYQYSQAQIEAMLEALAEQIDNESRGAKGAKTND